MSRQQLSLPRLLSSAGPATSSMNGLLNLFVGASDWQGDLVAAHLLVSLGTDKTNQIKAYGLGKQSWGTSALEAVLGNLSIDTNSAELLTKLPFISRDKLQAGENRQIPSMFSYIGHLTAVIKAVMDGPPIDAVVMIRPSFFAHQFWAGLQTAAESGKVRVPARIQYLGPTIGDWRLRRKELLRWKDEFKVDLMLCALSHEVAAWRELGVAAEHVGDPTVPSCRTDAQRQELSEEFWRQHGPGPAGSSPGPPAHGPVVGLLPGRHESDLKVLIPLYDAVLRRMSQRHGNLQAVLAVEPFWVEDAAAAAANFSVPTTVVDSRQAGLRALAACDVALATSGEGLTLSAAAQTPVVATSVVASMSDVMAYARSSRPRAAAPNLVLGRDVVPEVAVFGALSTNSIADKALELLESASARQSMLEDLQIFIQDYRGTPAGLSALPNAPRTDGAAEKAAQCVLSCVTKTSV